MDILVKNGTIISDGATFSADIAIADGSISEIGARLSPEENTRVIDAADRLVFPGLIDGNARVTSTLFGSVSCDDFESISKAALHSGVTTIIDTIVPQKNESLLNALSRKKDSAEQKALVDFSFHGYLSTWNDQIRGIAEDLIQTHGIPTFQGFLFHPNDQLTLKEGSLYAALRDLAGNAILMISPGNPRISARLLKENQSDNSHLALQMLKVAPSWLEAQATNMIGAIVENTSSRVYIMNVSSRRMVNSIRNLRDQGLNIFAETTPAYLSLTRERLEADDGHLYSMLPPLRNKSDVQVLWRALDEGILDVITSGHAAYSSAQKSEYKNTIQKYPFGLSMIEFLLPLLNSEGVEKLLIDMTHLITLLTANPARIFGLYPGKGVIQVGSDADIVIFDPEAEFSASPETSHSRSDIFPFDQRSMRGKCEIVIRRGEVALDNDEILAKPGSGNFIPRALSL